MKNIEVVAAIIKKGDQIFATQRGYGDWKDWWEFPGGKVEPGESPVQALRREIREELDTEISADKFLTTIEWDYPAFHLTMHCYMCSLLSEALHLNEHEAARWLGADELRSVQWLPADDQLLPLIEQELSSVVKKNKAMKELTIQEIETIVKRDENRIMEAKKTTGELAAAMQSGCAFLNTEGGWLFFGIHPQKLTLLGQDVADQTRQDIANAFRKFSPAIDLSAQYIEVPDKPGKYVIAIYFKAPKAFEAPYTYDGRPWYKVENTTAQMPREMFDERIRISEPEKFSWYLRGKQ